MSFMEPIELLAVWWVLALAGNLTALWFLRRFWKQRSELRLRTRVIASALLAGALSGALGTLLGLVKAFSAGGGESVDPSQRARILAEGLSEAISCTALSLLLFVPSVVGLIVILARKRKSTTAVGGEQ